MTYALIAALVTQSGVFAVLVNRLDSRNKRLIADLCQRVQAPETAVAQHLVGQLPQQPSHLPWGDDEAYMKYTVTNGSAATRYEGLPLGEDEF